MKQVAAFMEENVKEVLGEEVIVPAVEAAERVDVDDTALMFLDGEERKKRPKARMDIILVITNQEA